MKWFLFLSCALFFSCTMRVPEPVKEQNGLSDFVTKNLSVKDIQEVKEDSVRLFSRTDSIHEMIYDTLRNKRVRIILSTCYGNKESQVIFVNGKEISRYEKSRKEEGDLLSVIENSFRHFKFKGREFYYMQAMPAGRSGGSAALIRYQLFFDVQNKVLSKFLNFRIEEMPLFGNVNGDDRLDFLQIENEGGYGIDSINNFTVKIWSCNKEGIFEVLKDSTGKEYSLEGNSGSDKYVGQNFNIRKYYWPVKLN